MIIHESIEIFDKTGFDLTTPDSCFTILLKVFTNHILAENTYSTNHKEWGEHKIIVLIPANRYQIIRQYHSFKNILIDDYQYNPFLYGAKVLLIFYGAKNNKLQRRDS